MAELTQGRVDTISRENGTLISQSTGGSSQTINLTEPSVVRISGTCAMVAQYERQGDDLVLHMRDGSTVRYQKFFFDDAEGEHSELVFDDGVNPPEHALFPQTAEGAELASNAVTPTYESLDSVEPLLLADNTNSSMGVITAGGLGVLGLAGLAIGAGGGGGGDNNNGVDPGTPGNPPTAGAPTITLNPFAGDDVLSGSEKTTDQTLSGSTSNVQAGQIVTITLGSQSFNATAGADGSWSITLPPATLAALTQGAQTITATASDLAGNTDSTALNVVTEVTAPTPTFNDGAFGADSVLNISEAAAGVTLTGSTGSIGDNQAVSITVDLNGSRYNGTVDGAGNWVVNIPANALSSLGDGAHTLTVNVVDAAGNTGTTELAFTADLTAPQPTVDAQFLDGYINAADVAAGFTLSGTTGETGANQTVRITMGDAVYSTLADASGNWTLPLSNKAEAYTGGLKYDANNIYLAAMYTKSYNATRFGSSDSPVFGYADKAENWELVAQYQFDFGLRPSLAYVTSRGTDVQGWGKQNLKKYIDVGATYYFNKNMSTYVDYQINLLDDNQFTDQAGINTDDVVALGLVYQF